MGYTPKRPKKLTPEGVFLFLGLFGFIVFIWIIAFLFLPLLTKRPVPIALAPIIVEMAATRGFVLPPTWTPSPTRQIIPTATSTLAFNGEAPTRIYTPRATSLPGLPLPFRVPTLSVLDLARIMQGESPGDKEAAYMVGWVAKNRLLHPSYGDTYAVVSHGFFGYRPDLSPSKEFMDIARRVIKARDDPTGGCLYALSRTDITNLGVPPSRADVAFGEWFFFKTWPVGNRGR
ncbi:MAG: hypothetical protein L6R45_33660 [Anaerolineae bacterium]|nr:hypothetical protein [Anaerolineae bacterium]